MPSPRAHTCKKTSRIFCTLFFCNAAVLAPHIFRSVFPVPTIPRRRAATFAFWAGRTASLCACAHRIRDRETVTRDYYAFRIC